jgi:hypothetical protein
MLKPCVVCGKEFLPHRGCRHQKACGKECRKEYKRQAALVYYASEAGDRSRQKQAERDRTQEVKRKKADYSKTYRRSNPAAVLTYMKAYRERPEAKERRRRSFEAWKASHPERMRELNANHLARKRVAELMSATATLKESLNVHAQTAGPGR